MSSPGANYMRVWRANHPEAEARNRRRQMARARALEALRRRHPEEWEELYAEERKRAMDDTA